MVKHDHALCSRSFSKREGHQLRVSRIKNEVDKSRHYCEERKFDVSAVPMRMLRVGWKRQECFGCCLERIGLVNAGVIVLSCVLSQKVVVRCDADKPL